MLFVSIHLFYCKNMAVKQKKTPKPKESIHKKISELSLVQFWKNDQVRFISGLILLVLMVYISILLISFFFTGASDQSLVQGLSFGELAHAGNTRNWAGTFGAWLSNIIMNEWFGISSLLLAAFGLLSALRLMRVKTIPLKKTFIYCCFLTIWFSIFFGFCTGESNNNRFLFLGGGHGYHINQWLNATIGWIGSLLLLIVSLLIFMTFSIKRTIPVLRKIFRMEYLPKIERKPKEASTESFVQESDSFSSDAEESSSGNGSDFGAEDFQENAKNQNTFDDIEEFIETKSEEDRLDSNEASTSEQTLSDTEDRTDIEMTITIAKGDNDDIPESEELPEPLLSGTVRSKDQEYDALAELGEYDPKADLPHFKNPPIHLLKQYDDTMVVNEEEQKESKNKIINALESFGIRITSIQATVGPTVTLFEIVTEAGIRISKIKNLENDIAMNLSALGIRIIAPIPGKGTIGIEVPNRNPKIVSMYSLVHSKKFQETKYDLPVVIGKTIMNEVFMFDLCKMPHILIAGSTGQGKSVGLNALITSLLYKKHPSELKFVMVDPKMVEFSIYSAIEKYYLAKLPGDENRPIITDYTKVIQTLQSLTIEMDNRYQLLQMARCRNIKEYNAKFIARRLNPEKGHKFMPYIVIIIDEFGDLIMTAGKEIEMPIARIAQKARAVGMHMVIATQRPTTNIITGTIKANFPARLAYRVTSVIDSRTILDTGGANQLIGKGDALFLQGSDPVRVQCAFVDTPEVIDIVDYISQQRSYLSAFELPEYVDENDIGSLANVDLSSRDPLFEDAARLLVIHQQGSTSLIQRKFSIGYTRAGRIVDQLEAAGIVGPSEGSKARQVLVDDEMHLDMLLNAMK